MVGDDKAVETLALLSQRHSFGFTMTLATEAHNVQDFNPGQLSIWLA